MVDQCMPVIAHQRHENESGDEVTAGEAAYILGVSLATLYRWQGEKKHIDKIGPYQYGKHGRYRYKKSELLAFKHQKAEE